MVDNFDIIKQFIRDSNPEFDSNADQFYAVEIIHRAKDGESVAVMPRSGGNSLHLIKAYYINSIDELDKRKNEIITMCEAFNARAYISVNVKSYEQITKQAMIEYANRIAINDFKKPQSVFNSCVGKYVNRSTQLWILDVDKEDAEHMNMSIDDLTDFYKHIVETEVKPCKQIVAMIPTRSGKHIITHPFDTQKFFNAFPIGQNSESLIKKNNPTLLYIK
jgi:hypothetical protein